MSKPAAPSPRIAKPSAKPLAIQSPPATNSATPAVKSTAATALLPPVYLSSQQNLSQPMLDSSSLLSSQMNYSKAICDGIEQKSASGFSEGATGKKTDVKTKSYIPVKDNKASSKSGSAKINKLGAKGDSAKKKGDAKQKTSEGDGEKEVAGQDVAGQQMAAGGVQGGAGAAVGDAVGVGGMLTAAGNLAASAIAGVVAGAASGGGAAAEDDFKEIEVVVAKAPKLVPIVAPWVPSPPAQAIQRRDEIIKRTGSSPEQHHANVRQAAEHAAQSARAAQRRMVWQLSNIARSARISIEDLADEIPKVTAAAIAQIRTAIKTTTENITTSAAAETKHIDSEKVLSNDKLEASRSKTSVDVGKKLIATSDAVKKLDAIAQAQFATRLVQAKASVTGLPKSGVAPGLTSNKKAKADAKAKKDTAVAEPAAAGKAGAAAEQTYKIVSETNKPLEDAISQQINVSGTAGEQTKAYMQSRVDPVKLGATASKDKELVSTAESFNKMMDSDASRAEFTTMVLGLTTPLSSHHKQDKAKSVDPVDLKAELTMTGAEQDVLHAKQTINQKRDQGVEYCDKDLRENLVGNIQKTGRKAYLSLREQAGTTEVALANSAIPMALAYRELIDRIDALLPKNQLLDSRDLVPKLLAARASAEKLRSEHEQGGKQQAADAVKQMESIKTEQAEGILKSAQEAAESVADVAVQTAFDMAVFAGQMTGKMSANSATAIDAAQTYADKVATRLMRSLEQSKEQGLDNLDEGAVNYLNGFISGAQKSQYRTLSAFVKQMETEESPLLSSIKGSGGILETRAKELQGAMPEASAATAVGLSLIPVVGTIAAGVYVYAKDADENKVLQQLGGLQWPGVPAVAEVFGQHYGSLEDRINARMAEPQKGTALTLLKGSDEERAKAREDAIRNSTGLLDYNSRETREALAQGMNAAERGTMSPEQVKALTEYLQNNLNTSQAEITSGYVTGNIEQVVAARTKEGLDKGQREGEWGWIFSAESAQKRSDQARVDAIGKMDSLLREELRAQSDYIDESKMEEKNNKVIREFAAMIAAKDKDGRKPRQEDISMADARSAFKTYATKGHYTSVVSGLTLAGIPDVRRVEMGADAKDFINTAIDDPKGVTGEKAKIKRGIFEFNRAKEDGKPSETTQTRLSDAFENRELATFLRKANDESLPVEERLKYKRLAEDARSKNQKIMQGVAAGLKDNVPENIKNDPEKSEAWMADQMGKMFALTDGMTTQVSHARYGQEMILGGRASLDAGVALASDGSGTHEDLLLRSYADRTHSEIAAANKRWKSERNGEDMEEMLGIKKREMTAEDEALALLSPLAYMALRGPETSGDLTMQLERLAQGNRESDLDYVKYAGLHYHQERVRGTGFIAEHSMQGTAEQKYLDDERDQLAKTILAAARRQNPELAAQYEKNPGAIFNADGSLKPGIQEAAFDGGKLRGSNGAVLRDLSEGVSFAAEAYRAEIDRQEAMLTTGITILALVASVALMIIPGVNIVAAGVITAIVAGAATIAVKAGMRGERYGWEEAAMDIAMTAVEAATAGFGGAMAGGLGKTGMLARLGETLVARLGKVGGAIAREAIVNAVSSAAHVAMQDGVWSDGFSRGLERVASGAIRGAVIAAVTTGISESITQKLTPALHVGELDPSKITGAGAQRMGPHSREMLREALTNSVSNMAGEAVGLMIDYSTGEFHGTFLDALSRVGMSGMREMAMGAARGGIMSLHRETYRNLLDIARSGGTLSEPQLRALRAFGISAGALHYDNDMHHVLSEVQDARALLERMPSELREQAKSFDKSALQNIVGMLEARDLGHIGDWQNPAQKEFLSELASSVPGLDTRAFMAALELAVVRRQTADADSEMKPDVQSHVREQLGSHLHESAKILLENLPLQGLQYLGDVELAKAAAMIAGGKFNSAHADELFRIAQKNNPHVDEFSFLGNLHKAVDNSLQFHEALTKAAAIKRQGILAMVPSEAASLFTQLPDADLALAHRLIQSGELGSAREQAALVRAAQKVNPDLSSAEFQQFMKHAVEQVQQRKTIEAGIKRSEREQRMTHVQENLRGILSALPEEALVELRLRQMEGDLSPAEKNRLVKMAQGETPDVDVALLRDALEQAVKHTPAQWVSEAETLAMRKQLLSAVPSERQSLVEKTRIMVLPAEEFAAFTRSQKGQAVTLIIDGKPVVIVREGASPHVLREEGIHAWQAQDEHWASHIGSLDERNLSQWDSLPLEQQIVLYRNKVSLELDAQQRMLHALQADINNASNPQQKNSLKQQLAQVQNAHENLSRRHTEVGGIDALDIANIKAGFSEKPQWLDQPARLFSKEAPLTPEQQVERQDLIVRVMKNVKAVSDEQMQLHYATASSLSLESLRGLVNLHPNAKVVRDVFLLAHQSGNAKAFIEQSQYLSARIGFVGMGEVIRSEHGGRLLISLAQTGETRSLEPIIRHCANMSELQRNLDRLGSAAEPSNLTKHLNNVLSLLTTSQAFEFTARLARMEFANVPDHVLAFSHLAISMSDPIKVQTLMHLVSKMNAGDYFSFILDLNILSNGVLSQFAQHLGRFAGVGVFDRGHLLSRVVEMAATQREWKSFLGDVRDLLRIVKQLPNTPENQLNTRKLMGYLLNPKDQPIHLSADIIAAAKALGASAKPEDIFRQQVARLQTADARLMGGDAWQIFLESQKIEWNHFKSDPLTANFAKLLASHPNTQGWGEGHLGAISEIHPWFEHLAKARAKALGLPELDLQARSDLLSEIFNRGFGKGAQQLTSEGKLTELNRAFRELAVEAHTGISIRSLATDTPDPQRMADALQRLGISDAELALRPDRDILAKHIYELTTRQQFYEAMRLLDSSGTSGIQQNITEVIGEIALTQHMLATKKNFSLETPFGKGTGFDQVWIQRNASGEIIQFIVGEAKGPGAKLASPGKGPQMSAEWVFNTVKEMLVSSDAHTRWLGEQMLKAIIESRKTGKPLIHGMVIEAATGSGSHDITTATTGKDGYKFSGFTLTLGGP